MKTTVRPYCPKCGHSGMILISGMYGDFWGCRNWKSKGCTGKMKASGPCSVEPVAFEIKPRSKKEQTEYVRSIAAREFKSVSCWMRNHGFFIHEFQPGVHYRIQANSRGDVLDYRPSTGRVAFPSGPSSPKGALSYADGHTIQWVCENLDIATSLARRQISLGELMDELHGLPEPHESLDAEFRSIVSEAPF